MKNRLLNIHVIISLSNFSILLSDIPKLVSQKPYQGVLCWCGCPEYPVQERCSQGFPFAHKKYHIPGRHDGQLRPGLYRICFINFYHLVTKRRSFTILPCRISPLSLIFTSQKFCQILDFMGKSLFGSSYRASDTGLYKQLVPIQLQNSGIAEVSTRFSMVPLIFLTPNGMFIR